MRVIVVGQVLVGVAVFVGFPGVAGRVVVVAVGLVHRVVVGMAVLVEMLVGMGVGVGVRMDLLAVGVLVGVHMGVLVVVGVPVFVRVGAGRGVMAVMVAAVHVSPPSVIPPGQ